MKAFEYLTINAELGDVKGLNEAAEKGWRVISVNPAKILLQAHDQITTHLVYLLEREKE